MIRFVIYNPTFYVKMHKLLQLSSLETNYNKSVHKLCLHCLFCVCYKLEHLVNNFYYIKYSAL